MEFTRRSLELGPIELVGLSLNPTLHWYGLIIVGAIITATLIVSWLAKRDDEDTELVWNGLIWVIIAGVIGARLWSVIFPAGDAGEGRTWNLDYLTDLENGPIAIWSGGLSIFGAVLGGIFGGYLFARKHKLDKLYWFDRVIIVLPLAQAIGRWGNFINEELYGKPTDLPWGIKITAPLAPYTADQRFHPLFLYESLLNVVLFGALLFLWTRRRQWFQRGDFMLFYFAGYGIIRFMLEFIRVEIPTVGEINASQATTAFMVIGSLGILIAKYRLNVEALQTEQHTPFLRLSDDKEAESVTDDDADTVKKPVRSKRREKVSIHKSGEFRGVQKARRGKGKTATHKR